VSLSVSRVSCVPLARLVLLLFWATHERIQRFGLGDETCVLQILKKPVTVTRRTQQLQTCQHHGAAAQLLQVGFKCFDHTQHYTVPDTLSSITHMKNAHPRSLMTCRLGVFQITVLCACSPSERI